MSVLRHPVSLFAGAGIWCVIWPAVSIAQEAARPNPLEPSDTSSPAATVKSLIDSCNELNGLISAPSFSAERAGVLLPTTERILDCLDLSELPKELRETAGIESALFLKEVLDRIELPAPGDIPSEDSASDTEPLLRWQIPGTRIAIARMGVGPYRNAYLFTPGTVRRAAQYYRMVKALPYRTGGDVVSQGLYDAYVAVMKQKPTQTADTSSPRGTLTLFLDSCDEFYLAIRAQRYIDRSNPELHRIAQTIISCLDTSGLPEYSREYFDSEAAVCLKEVLDRIPLPQPEEIPGIESVETADTSVALSRWQVPRTQIVISRMEEGPRRGEFLFSSDTVVRAPEFFQKAMTQPYRSQGRTVSDGFYTWWLSSPGTPEVAAIVERLPTWFQERKLGMAIWQWIGLLLAIPVSLAVMFLAFHLGRIQAEKMRERSLLRYWLCLGFSVIAVAIPLVFKHFVFEYLTVRADMLYVVTFAADLVFLIGVIGLMIGGSNRIAESIIALPDISAGGLDANLIRIISRVLGIVAAVIVFLEGGRYLGFPITTLIASAGIGGLAIALSAQGLIKGLFGTVTILMDKPFRVGERIVVKGHDGFVEEIGLRSTKIRALSNHVISVPNDQIADSEIENIGKRKYIRRVGTLRIPIDTPREQVEAAIAGIRTILDNHEGMNAEFPPRVYFKEFTADAFEIQFMFWYSPPDRWAFYEFSEKVNLAIFRAFEDRGIQFSLPLRHTYWKHDDQQGPLEVVLNSPADGVQHGDDHAGH